jgi:very-short-patch-repair endonuclease
VRIEGLGFSWDQIAGETKIRLVETPHFDRLQEQLAQLEPIVKARSRAALWKGLEQHRREIHAAGARLRTLDQPARISGTLSQTLENLSVQGYELAFGYLQRLEGLEPILSRRSELLERLASAAPAWAEAIRQRRGVHEKPNLPGEPEAAWYWRQIDEELDRRGAESLSDLQRQIEEKSRELRRVTADLIEQKAWAEQVRRIDLDTRLALGGWRDLIRQTPKTSIVRGKLARLRRARQDAMRRSRFAVPVWIMPLNRVVENFDFASTHFDVVIIDEASQMDVSGLLPYYLAQKVLVVGDHEQVSPSAVGQKGDVVENLIREHLQGIPNADLYNGQTSIYDLARHSSEGHTCLVEHFRCVPEIIQFSNDLCYRGQIQPLRDPTTSRVRPAVIPYRVEGPFDGTRPRVNDVEALAVASLIVACSEQPEYRELTMGVVSMVGDEQAIEIERLLRTHLAVDEYERHQLVCGNSAQFQGDERDLMFLSLVDRPGDGPLRFRGDTPSRQRFNVAGSRARDQTWVAFSVDPDHDLQAEDLRKRLIDHSRDPRALVRKLDRVEKETESEFERQVARRLVRRGFRVLPQFRIGYYRIDLVVEGTSGKRLAVECDGARWHPIEKLGEDMARQATLERLGWTFARIRGTEFFRDPDRAMERVFVELDRLGIGPAPDGEDQEREAEAHALEDALVKRVTQRAAELRRQWAGADETGTSAPAPDPPARTGESSPAAHRALSQADRGEAPTNVATQQESARVLDFGRSGSVAGKETPSSLLRPKSSALPQHSPNEEGEEPRDSYTDHRDRLPQTDAQIWYAISHWAKAAGEFRGWERRLVYDIGRYLERGWRITAKQAEHAVRLFEEASTRGFSGRRARICEREDRASEEAGQETGRSLGPDWRCTAGVDPPCYLGVASSHRSEDQARRSAPGGSGTTGIWQSEEEHQEPP